MFSKLLLALIMVEKWLKRETFWAGQRVAYVCTRTRTRNHFTLPEFGEWDPKLKVKVETLVGYYLDRATELPTTEIYYCQLWGVI